MSTRSSITVKNEKNGKFYTIYCHWDGYPEWVGTVLETHYNTQEKANALIALGDLSSLDVSIDCPEGHSFDHRISGYTVAYGRDRGEENTSAREYDTHEDALKVESQSFDYLFDGKKWVWQ